ncbi:MAG: 50S ribosomal protein L25 [Patescibacteria group bacterium]|nr:50S ribosomal protein L25 [Patescibacteria group bacterium]
MVKSIKLDAKIRSNLNAKKLRIAGILPAVIYSPGVKPQNLEIKRQDFENAYSIAGEANLIDIIVDGKNLGKVIIKAIQRDAVKDIIIHADLYKVDMTKKIEVEIPLNYCGEAKAVKELGGNLIKNIESVSAKCLPGDLTENIDVDISALNTFEDSIKVKDLKIPENVELLVQGNELVAHVMELKIEEEEVEAATAEEEEPGEKGKGEVIGGEKEKTGKENEDKINKEKK